MKWLRALAVLAVSLVLASSTEAADKGDAKKGKAKAKSFKGTVVAVKKDADKDSGTVTIKTAANKKKGTPAGEKTFTVGTSTKVEKFAGGKATGAATPAKFGAVHKGEKVVVVARGEGASEIKILSTAKKKTAKKAAKN